MSSYSNVPEITAHKNEPEKPVEPSTVKDGKPTAAEVSLKLILGTLQLGGSQRDSATHATDLDDR